MANVVVVGMQWGDEGKGKIVDLLCPAFDVVARYQGGNNAGHTVKFGDRHFALHLIPSGILHADKICVLGNGMVINPEALFEELDSLHSMGVETAGRLLISARAHLLLPILSRLDEARETARGEAKIGTTVRGIGPAYELKASRGGMRLGDLFSSHFEERLRYQLSRVERELRSLGSETRVSWAALAEQCAGWRQRLEPYLRDVAAALNDAIDAGQTVLFEGAQGALLDLDHGTYPYVTSSNSTAGGASVGTGVPPTSIDGVLGVVKAYASRVGEGPFVTEVLDQPGEFLRRRGNEFGTTTGRPRRCGWLDMVACRYARRINGIESLALTKLDVLDTLAEIPVCVGYKLGGATARTLREFPQRVDELEAAEPVYTVMSGWQTDTTGITEVDDLPRPARDYIGLLESEISARVELISTGPKREQTAVRGDGPLAAWLEDRVAAVLEHRGALS